MKNPESFLRQRYPTEVMTGSLVGGPPRSALDAAFAPGLVPGLVVALIAGVLQGVRVRRLAIDAGSTFGAVATANRLRWLASTVHRVADWDRRGALLFDVPMSAITAVRIQPLTFGSVLELHSGHDVARMESTAEKVRAFAASLPIPTEEIAAAEPQFWVRRAFVVVMTFLVGVGALIGAFIDDSNRPVLNLAWGALGIVLVVIAEIFRRQLFRRR